MKTETFPMVLFQLPDNYVLVMIQNCRKISCYILLKQNAFCYTLLPYHTLKSHNRHQSISYRHMQSYGPLISMTLECVLMLYVYSQKCCHKEYSFEEKGFFKTHKNKNPSKLTHYMVSDLFSHILTRNRHYMVKC